MAKEIKNENIENVKDENGEVLALDDERRVKVLSPAMLVFKRFIRNKLAIVGCIFILAMFLFSFVGALVSPCGEDEVFKTYKSMKTDYGSATQNQEIRYTDSKEHMLDSLTKARFIKAKNGGETEFVSKDASYTIETIGDDVYAVFDADGNICTVASLIIYDYASADVDSSPEFRYAAEKAVAAGEDSFTYGGEDYSVDRDGDFETILNSKGEVIVSASDYIVNAISPDIFLSIDEKAHIIESIENGDEKFELNGTEYFLERDNLQWTIKKLTERYVNDAFAFPSAKHWLGTDGNGMDILTRLMYGGQVSLLIGFIVIILETVIGVIMGGISGYFGGWVDNLIMRIVDVFNCIPSTPLIIIIGAVMDGMKLDPDIRMLWLMLILGFLGWPGVARLVRGQILSLREQEFMTATEATGLSASRRIFKHLVPNVAPQLIVTCTMGLGGVILTESTLSFLGLGVKYPFASWGNIINAVSNIFVMTNYWFVWIPAGFCILITVLGFNFIGDGLRDAFDPKMKR